MSMHRYINAHVSHLAASTRIAYDEFKSWCKSANETQRKPLTFNSEKYQLKIV